MKPFWINAVGYDLNPDAIEARLENGVLEITLPRSEATRPRKIEVRNAG